MLTNIDSFISKALFTLTVKTALQCPHQRLWVNGGGVRVGPEWITIDAMLKLWPLLKLVVFDGKYEQFLRLVHTVTAMTNFIFAIAATAWTPLAVAMIPIFAITSGCRTHSMTTLNNGKKLICFVVTAAVWTSLWVSSNGEIINGGTVPSQFCLTVHVYPSYRN